MKIYISGGISKDLNFKKKFRIAEEKLLDKGHAVINPAIMPIGFSQEEYMHVDLAMLDICDGVYLLNNWESSKGANIEYEYAKKNNKYIFFEEVENASRTNL